MMGLVVPPTGARFATIDIPLCAVAFSTNAGDVPILGIFAPLYPSAGAPTDATALPSGLLQLFRSDKSTNTGKLSTFSGSASAKASTDATALLSGLQRDKSTNTGKLSTFDRLAPTEASHLALQHWMPQRLN